MGQRVGTHGARDLDLALGDERPRGRRAEEVLPVVDGTGAQGREDEIAHELFAQILHIAFLRTGGEGLFADATELVSTLADVGSDADDASVVVLAEPRHDDGGVETAGIGEDD